MVFIWKKELLLIGYYEKIIKVQDIFLSRPSKFLGHLKRYSVFQLQQGFNCFRSVHMSGKISCYSIIYDPILN